MQLNDALMTTIKKGIRISEEVRIKSGGITLKIKETHTEPRQIYFEVRKGGKFSSSDTVDTVDHPLLEEVIKFNTTKGIDEVLLVDYDGAFARVSENGRMDPYAKRL